MVLGHLEHTCALQDRDWQGAALLAWVGILAWPAVPGPLLSFLSLPFPRFLWAPILLPTAEALEGENFRPPSAPLSFHFISVPDTSVAQQTWYLVSNPAPNCRSKCKTTTA